MGKQFVYRALPALGKKEKQKGKERRREKTRGRKEATSVGWVCPSKVGAVNESLRTTLRLLRIQWSICLSTHFKSTLKCRVLGTAIRNILD